MSWITGMKMNAMDVMVVNMVRYMEVGVKLGCWSSEISRSMLNDMTRGWCHGKPVSYVARLWIIMGTATL